MGLLLVGVLNGCAGEPSPTASPIPTLAPVEVALPNFDTEVDGMPVA